MDSIKSYLKEINSLNNDPMKLYWFYLVTNRETILEKLLIIYNLTDNRIHNHITFNTQPVTAKHLRQNTDNLLKMGKMDKKYGVSLGKLEELKNSQIKNRSQTLKMESSVDVSLTHAHGTTVIQNCVIKFENNQLNIKTSVGDMITSVHLSEVVLRRISPLKISLQMKADYAFELISIKFNTEEHKNIVVEMLPRPERPPSFHGETETD
ncbi:hypothetical protein QE152_g36713 [Popillia japonica]|uniref:Uncharacterized protein n=1 Tax=Popillia japonica TaxID=7064 RepID=A0AAW1ICQ8_POPJA